MAYFALGISKSAVEALLNKVKSAVEEEAEKLQIVGRDIVFIKDEFEMMQSFLSSANRKHIKDQVESTWVRHIRDLSYDTEDCIDFVLNLDTKPKVWKRFLRSASIPLQLQEPLPLDQAIADINQLKARAIDVNKRNIRYSSIGGHGEQMRQTSAASQRTHDIFLKQTDAFDNQDGVLDLASLITTEGKGLQVISVCGTGGDLGIIPIVKKAYDDTDIRGMFDCRSWVKLMHPFNPNEFIRSLLAGFYMNSPNPVQEAESSNTRWWGLGLGIVSMAKMFVGTKDVGAKVMATMEANQHSILREYMKTIQGKTYLIVLEDLSSIAVWNAIRAFMPDMNNRSRIVVITQQLDTASLCTEKPKHGLLREFSTDHSVYAFFKELPKTRRDSSCQAPCEMEPAHHGLRDPGPDHWQEHHLLFGRASEIMKIKEQIEAAYQQNVNAVISVFGIAGVGKSFLVGAFYDHFAKKFDNCSVLSASYPFDIMNFCLDLFHDLVGPNQREDDDIFHGVCKHLEEKQCLVVIDDLRSKENWDLIEAKLISRKSKSCIIVTTREESVARHCATSDKALCRVKGLEADASRRLIQQATSSRDNRNENRNWDSEMMEEAEHIIKNCGRLPKLLVALVKYLTKTQNDMLLEARRLNASFMYALDISKRLPSFRDVFHWIYSNFQGCPQLVKQCVFYLSIFTETRMIRQSWLVRRWVAEGYSEVTDTKGMVEYTENLIHQLVNLGIMEHPQRTFTAAGDMTTCCQIHSLFLQYVIARETEENIFPPLEFFVLQGESSLNPQRVGQHLAIGSSWKRDKFVFDNLDVARVRSLTVSREWAPFLVSDRMKRLRVLDLEDTNVSNNDLDRILSCKLPHLKFLCLRRCKNVSRLPEFLGNHTLLQTLDIRHTSVNKLPKIFIKLKKLQYVRASTTPWSSNRWHDDAWGGITVPRGIGTLETLHTLGVVNISKGGGSGKHVLKQLKKLTKLNKLGVSGVNQSNVKSFNSTIEGHNHLKSLSLQLYKQEVLGWIGKINTPQKLDRLKMYIHLLKHPNLSSLQIIGRMPRLQTLSLCFETGQAVELQFSDDRRSSHTPDQFGELKVLKIACSSNLHVKFFRSDMGKLEMLNVHCLNGSTLRLSGIEHLPSLMHVWLKGSFDDGVTDQLRREVATNTRKPVCKLN